MKWVYPLLKVAAMLIDAWHDWQRRNQRDRNENIQDDPSAELRRRGWMRDEPSEDVQPDAPDKTHDNGDGR